MSTVAAGVIGTMLCLVLVGSALLARHRRGEPIARYTLVWAGLFAAAFVVALIFDRSGSMFT